jgi:hypothetical protein
LLANPCLTSEQEEGTSGEGDSDDGEDSDEESEEEIMMWPFHVLRVGDFLGNSSAVFGRDQKVHTKFEKEGWGAGCASGDQGFGDIRKGTPKSNSMPFV